ITGFACRRFLPRAGHEDVVAGLEEQVEARRAVVAAVIVACDQVEERLRRIEGSLVQVQVTVVVLLAGDVVDARLGGREREGVVEDRSHRCWSRAVRAIEGGPADGGSLVDDRAGRWRW